MCHVLCVSFIRVRRSFVFDNVNLSRALLLRFILRNIYLIIKLVVMSRAKKMVQAALNTSIENYVFNENVDNYEYNLQNKSKGKHAL